MLPEMEQGGLLCLTERDAFQGPTVRLRLSRMGLVGLLILLFFGHTLLIRN